MSPTLQPHQERVVAEKAELDARLDKLRPFLQSDSCFSLPMAERGRLYRQEQLMTLYSEALAERIAAF